MTSIDELHATAKQLTRRGYGILAADESTGTIGKRLQANNLPNDAATRNAWRDILLTAPGNETALSGILLFQETLYQNTLYCNPNASFVSNLVARGILPGVKVDTGLEPLAESPLETRTKGLHDLYDRCKQYYTAGARFAKWRATLRIDTTRNLPTDNAIDENATTLALYAADAQRAGLVPIVEPEILIDGTHDVATAANVSRRVLKACYAALRGTADVKLSATLLKPMMMLPGVHNATRGETSAMTIARATLDVMRDCVPAEVAGIVFLSGGMNEREATENLNVLNQLAAAEGGTPWSLSFSYGRALQSSALQVWGGRTDNVERAKEVAAALARVNGQAQLGVFDGVHPSVCDEKKTLYEGFRGWSGRDGTAVKGKA